ncbi:MAG: hypothetical protein NTV86_05165 [Planctomycetota bacterium]|nr:hypothetical protein [Planctomycetota bacterium]
MNDQLVPNSPAIGGVYIPYFYQAGLYRYRSLPAGNTRASATPPTAAYARYDFSSDLVAPTRPYRPQTMEQVIAKGYFAVPAGDPTTAIVSDRKNTSSLGLDDIISQIRTRYQIYSQNLYEMDLASCAAANNLYHLVAYRGGMPPNSREVYAVHKRLQEIYQERREERVSLWQDVSRLRLSLPEVAQQYLSAYRKVYFLESTERDVG